MQNTHRRHIFVAVIWCKIRCKLPNGLDALDADAPDAYYQYPKQTNRADHSIAPNTIKPKAYIA